MPLGWDLTVPPEPEPALFEFAALLQMRAVPHGAGSGT